jgi:2-hydroxy-6-oxonona-2,4-dienedioate hydrolase
MESTNTHTVTLPNGEEIAYRQIGHGPKTIVLIHGNMSSSIHWQSTMDALADTYTVYAPDLRGFGDSSYHQPFDSLEDLARDLSDWFDLVGVKQATVVGWSTGAGVAFELAALRPDLVEKVVTLGGVPVTGYPIYQKDEQGNPILTKLHDSKASLENDVVQVIPIKNALANRHTGFVTAVLNSLLYAKNIPADEEAQKLLNGVFQQRCIVDTYHGLVTLNLTDQPTKVAPASGKLNKITCPIVMLHGADDLVVPFAWGQDSYAKVGDKALFVPLPNMGHSPMTDNFDEYLEILKNNL